MQQPVVTMGPKTPVREAAAFMRDRRIRHLPGVNAERVSGPAPATGGHGAEYEFGSAGRPVAGRQRRGLSPGRT